MVAYTSYPYDPRVRREAEALEDRGQGVDFICFRKNGHRKMAKILTLLTLCV